MNTHAKPFLFVFLVFALLSYVIGKTGRNTSSESPKKFVIITVLYNETNRERIAEYTYCLKKNLHHPLIDHIHLVYDVSKDNLSEKHFLRDYIQEKGIAVSYVDGRPTYGYCFGLANKLYSNRCVILSNADIFFNDTLAALNDYDLANKFLALTRWNVREDGEIVPYNVHHRIISQDTWIFETPLRQFKDDAIAIGTPECDSFIAYQAQKIGLTVLNPCLTIQCCHLHLSSIRNYELGKHNKLPSDYKPARLSRL